MHNVVQQHDIVLFLCKLNLHLAVVSFERMRPVPCATPADLSPAACSSPRAPPPAVNRGRRGGRGDSSTHSTGEKLNDATQANNTNTEEETPHIYVCLVRQITRQAVSLTSPASGGQQRPLCSPLSPRARGSPGPPTSEPSTWRRAAGGRCAPPRPVVMVLKESSQGFPKSLGRSR